MNTKTLTINSLGILLAVSTWATQTIDVRGARLRYPLEIRVRVASFAADKKFPMKIGRQNYDCEFQRNFPSPSLSITELTPVGNEWLCQNAKGDRTLALNSGFFLRASDLGVGIDGRTYIGKLRFLLEGENLVAINELDLERYLAGVVNREMSNHFPEEALKAQVIAARSYAIATLADRMRKNATAFLYSSEADQVYEGVTWESSKSRRLVKETLGNVLFQNNEVLKAYYHASSGGSLETPDNAWAQKGSKFEKAAYQVKEIPDEITSNDARWNINLSPMMGYRWGNLGKIKDIQILEKSPSERVKKILLKGDLSSLVISGADFRKKLGNRWLKSTLFEIQKVKNSWLISGRGFGHGVGMSQMGARRMAEKGSKAEEILSFYYPNSSIGDIREQSKKTKDKKAEVEQLTAKL